MVDGRLDARWSAWFDGMMFAVERGDDSRPVTTLTGPVIDQAALYGILWKLRDLNLKLISVAPTKRKLTGPGAQHERRNPSDQLDSGT